ncbi:MAG: hypothetical protein ABIS06_11905 [Vicinamibacterales bacterium]
MTNPGVELAALLVTMLLVPFGLRPLDARYGTRDAVASYLPSLENPRARVPFDRFHLDDMARIRPELVVIGDSMAGSRIDPRLLAELSGTRTYAILQAASGSAFWYLAIKNWVNPSGITPRTVFMFFLDTNLTDVMFRLDDVYRAHLDRAAHEREDELNAVVGARTGAIRSDVEHSIEAAYGSADARRWMVPAFADRLSRMVEPGRRKRDAFVEG